MLGAGVNSGDTLKIDATATGTLTIPNTLTNLIIDGLGNTIAGNIVTNCPTVTLKDITVTAPGVASGNVTHALYGSVNLTLNIEGSVTLNGGATQDAWGGNGVYASMLTIASAAGTPTLTANGGNGGSHGCEGVYGLNGITIKSGINVHASGAAAAATAVMV